MCHRMSCFLNLAEVRGVRLVFGGVVADCTRRERPLLPLGLKVAVGSGT